MRFGYEVFHPDVLVVADFYRRSLAFGLVGEATEDHLVLERDGLRVGCSRFDDALLTPRKPPAGSEVVLRVDDLTQEYERMVASGWPIEDELQMRPWGLHDFRAFDPTGQYLRITSG